MRTRALPALPSIHAGGLSRRGVKLHRKPVHMQRHRPAATSGYPLHDAVAGQQIEVLQALLADGLDPNTAADGDNVRGFSHPDCCSHGGAADAKSESGASRMIRAREERRPYHDHRWLLTPG